MEKHLIYNQEISFSMSQMIKDLQKALLIILVTIISPIAISAQTANSYLNATTTTGSLAADLNGNTINMGSGTTTLAGNGDDRRSSVTSIGFTFYFAGTAYTQFSTNSNGYCQLGSTQISSYQYDLAGSNPLITPFGEDLQITTTGYNRGKLIGTSPNRCYVIEWNGVGVDYGSTSNNAQFQLRFYETSNKIEFVYGAMAVGNSFNTLTIDGARIGFSGSSSDIRTVVTPNTYQSPTSITASNVNNYTVGTITDLNSSSNGTRRTYVFSPPPTLTVTPTSLSFGYIASGSTSANQTYALSGSYLSPASGSITVTAPTGFEVSLSSGSGFGSLVNVSYSGSTLASTTIYARFKPTGSPQDYSGNITNAGGGATTVNVAVTGSSLAACSGTPAPGNTQASPNRVCIGNSVNLSLQNSVAAKGITYQWQSSPNGSTWSNITPVFINTDFSSQPANTDLYGGATISGGELILTTTAGNLRRAFKIQNTPGSNINPFTATYDYRIFDGTFGADGMSMNYGPDLTNDAGPTGDPGQEQGEGTGLRVCFDTYNGGTTSQIFIYYGGTIIWNNTLGSFDLRNTNYRTAIVTVDNNGFFSLSIGGTLIVSGLSLPGYVAADKSNWQFKFEARTGGVNDKHSLTNLIIQFGDNPTLTVSPTTDTYYRCQATCAVSASTGTSTSALVTVDPLSVAGTASSNQTICSGSSPSNITLSGNTGSIQWQSSLDNSSWSDLLGATSATLTSAQMGSLTQTTYYHAIVTSGVCSSATSNAVTVTVDPTSVGGTAAAAANALCTSNSGTNISLTGSNGTIQWQKFNGTGWDNVGAGGAQYSTGELSSTTYFRAVVTNGVCASANSNTVGVYINPSYKWIGEANDNNWSNASNWKFDGGQSESPAVPPISCSDVTIPNGCTYYPTTIPSSTSIVNLTLEDGASLMGNSNLTVSGSTTMIKNIVDAGWYWHLLSSPVAAQNIWGDGDMGEYNFVPKPSGSGYSSWTWPVSGINWDFYYFNPKVTNVYPNVPWVNLRDAAVSTNFPYNYGEIDDVAPNGTGANAGFGQTRPVFTPGRGYLVAYNTDYTTRHDFKGTLNSGNIPVTLNTTGSLYHLVGNPYPSALDWEDADWTRTGLVTENYASGYDFWIFQDGTGGGNYAIGNSAGNYTGNLSKYIPPMQGFFVKANSAGGSLEMTESVRAHSNQQWYKSVTDQSHKIRLKITTDKNSFADEMIVDFKEQYSGEEGSEKFYSMYSAAPEIWSVKNGNIYTIDRYKGLTSALSINISVKCGVYGTYTITSTGISEFELSNIVYLEDLKTGNKVNLKETGSYSFSGGPNDNKARFRITFAEITGTDVPEISKPVYIYSFGKDVYVNASSLTTGNCDVYIYDAPGRLVYNGKYTPVVGNHKFATLQTPGAYVVKVISHTGTTTAKIIIP